MGEVAPKDEPSGFRGLQSHASLKRLTLISNLRSRGVGDHINLPQLIVSGDQSTGKSSVLEGITGLPFPRQDGLCTRFATEITMEHMSDQEAETEITATIIPSESRDEGSKDKLRAFIRQLDNVQELPTVIHSAGELMGLRGYGGVQVGPAFGQDVLRIKVRGNTDFLDIGLMPNTLRSIRTAGIISYGAARPTASPVASRIVTCRYRPTHQCISRIPR